MVSKVNAETRSVTVEWYENGETKGKEVELDSILELNTEVEAAASSPKIVRQISGNPLSRVRFLNVYFLICRFHTTLIESYLIYMMK